MTGLPAVGNSLSGLGLTPAQTTPQSGECSIDGRDPAAAMAKLVQGIGATLDSRSDEASLLATLPDVISASLSERALLTAAQREFDPEKYARHLIYADPQGRFSVLALAWLPGQFTPVHGHNAWGVVGIYDGIMENTCYQVGADGPCAEERVDPQSTAPYRALGTSRVEAGRVVAVATGDSSAHRLRNAGPDTALTIHVYGMDLAAEPMGINRYYD